MSILEAVLVLVTMLVGAFAVYSAFRALSSKAAERGRRRNDLREIVNHKHDPAWEEAWAHLRRALFALAVAVVLMVFVSLLSPA